MEETRHEVEHLRSATTAGLNFVQHALTSFLVAEPGRKKDIALALASEYVLRGNELTVSIHPLLAELVRFIEECRPKLEPRISSSRSHDAAFFSTSIRVGRDTETLIEPPDSLIEVLRNSTVPNLFAQAVSGDV